MTSADAQIGPSRRTDPQEPGQQSQSPAPCSRHMPRAGEVVQPGQPLYKIANLGFRRRSRLRRRDAAGPVRLGSAAEVTVDAGSWTGGSLPGTVSWISSQAEFTPTPIQTREERADLVYAIKIRVANDDGLLKDRHAGRRSFSWRGRSRTQMTDAVVVQDVGKRFGTTPALSTACRVAIRSGELFGFIGPDGAGKTTLFRILATLLVPDTGSARVLGRGRRHQVLWTLRTRIGYMPGRFSLYPDLSVEENLRFFASVFGTTIEAEHERIAPIYTQLEPFKDRRAGSAVGRHEAEARALLRARPSARNPVPR